MQRNSRWDDAPVLDARGRPKLAVITERDVEHIFKPLARYRYLPADYLHAFSGGSRDYLIDRLNILSRRPNRYLSRPVQQRESAAANHRPLVYELGQRGVQALVERGLPVSRVRPPASFAHELMACELMASFELGARASGARIIRWSDILNSRSLPETTRSSPKPFHIPVPYDGAVVSIAADGEPFGIERSNGGQRSYFFSPGIEADCGTEPIDTSDFARSSIFRKLTLYLAIEAQGIHRTHFGFPNFYVPIITTNHARLASMMAVLERMTGSRGSKVFLFKTFPRFTFAERSIPSGRMLTEDWQRVGHPPFNFLTS